MNPEFRRNVLLELTLHRLIAMPAILLLIYAAAGLAEGYDAVSEAAHGVMIVLLVLWGTRLTADAVLGEVRARTWDSQRMSGIDPFAMSWAKLLGSTVYVWYGAALSVPALLYRWEADFLDLLRIVVLGLFAQAVALLVSLLVQRMRPERLRFQVTAAQLFGLGAALLYWNMLFGGVTGRHRFGTTQWFGMSFDNETFALATGAAFLAWACLGIYRLMRTELKFRSWPAGFTAFVIFCAVYLEGFSRNSLIRLFDRDLAEIFWRLDNLVPYIVVAGLTWLGAYVEPKGLVRLRRFAGAVAGLSPRRILEATPGWLPALLVAIVLGGYFLASWAWVLTVDGPAALSARFANLSPGAFAVALFLFLLRDIGVMYFLTLDGRARRAQITALIYLAILYVLLPIILAVLDLEAALPVLVPFMKGSPMVIVLPVLVQVGIVSGMLVWRWRRLAAAMEAGAP